MKFKIKTEKETKEEPRIELWIVEGSDSSIKLQGKDTNNVEKVLMEFREGRFIRFLDARLEGLETDPRGRIKEERE